MAHLKNICQYSISMSLYLPIEGEATFFYYYYFLFYDDSVKNYSPSTLKIEFEWVRLRLIPNSEQIFDYAASQPDSQPATVCNIFAVKICRKILR